MAALTYLNLNVLNLKAQDYRPHETQSESRIPVHNILSTDTLQTDLTITYVQNNYSIKKSVKDWIAIWFVWDLCDFSLKE